MSAWSEDALFVGRRIVERLAEQVSALREVSMIDELADATATPKQAPAAVVLLASMGPRSNAPAQERVPLEQDWLVLLAVRTRRAEADRNSAAVGALIAPVLTALQGWVPPGAQRPLTWMPGPKPDYGKDISYFGLMFRAQLVTD